MFFPFGTDRPARRRPAALDRHGPGLSRPLLGPAPGGTQRSLKHSRVPVSAAVTFSHERSCLFSHSHCELLPVLCDLRPGIAPRERPCATRSTIPGPPGPKCTRVTATQPPLTRRRGALQCARRRTPRRDPRPCLTVTRPSGPGGSPAHRVCPVQVACSRTGPQSSFAGPADSAFNLKFSSVVVVGSTWHRFQVPPRLLRDADQPDSCAIRQPPAAAAAATASESTASESSRPLLTAH